MRLITKPYRNLIILLTRRCPLRCPDCNIHPELGSAETIEKKQLTAFFSAITKKIIHGGVIWTGGEPFSALPELLFGLKLAQTHQMMSEILTSGSWYPDADQFLELLGPFKTGLNIRLSIDGAHLSQIKWQDIEVLCFTILKKGFKLSFTLRANDPYRLNPGGDLKKKLLDILARFDPTLIATPHLFHIIPHMPVASNLLVSTIAQTVQVKPPVCKLAQKDLVIGWDGRPYACCGLFLFDDNRSCSLDLPVNRLIFDQLRHIGPHRLAQQVGIPLPNLSKAPLNTPCYLCQYLWKNHIDQLQSYHHPFSP